jgi:hypothetical protein
MRPLRAYLYRATASNVSQLRPFSAVGYRLLFGLSKQCHGPASSRWRAFLCLLFFLSFLSIQLPKKAIADSFPSLNRAQLVTVFYANETSGVAFSSDHYRKLLKILESTQGQLAARIRADLIADAVDFPASVASNAAALREYARRFRFDLVIFTNELTLKQRYAVYRGVQDAEEMRTLAPPFDLASLHPFLSTAPLSDARMLHRALNEVASQYDRRPIDIVLLIYSHGTLDMALMPRANVDLRIADADEIRAAIEGDAAITRTWATLQGTSKLTFWNVLADVSATNRQVRFSLVLLAACQSAMMDWKEYFAIPDSVASIAHTGLDSPSIKSTHLEKLFENVDKNAISDTVPAGAREAGYKVDTRKSLLLWLVPVTLWRIPLAWYFAPLPLWLLWYSVAKWRTAGLGWWRAKPPLQKAE